MQANPPLCYLNTKHNMLSYEVVVVVYLLRHFFVAYVLTVLSLLLVYILFLKWLIYRYLYMELICTKLSIDASLFC